MPDSDTQPMPAEEITPPIGEPQMPTSAPELTPEIPQTKSVESTPAPIELPPTPKTSASVEPLSTPTEPQSATTPPPPSPTQTPQPPETARPHPRLLLQRAREKIQFRKRAKMEKIMALAVKKRIITNDDVEKLLRVSDATATRYCAELVRQGRLKQSGIRGSAKYEPL